MAAQVDINRATLFELDRIFRDRERAQQILNKRELVGDYKSWDDVRERLPGMTERLIQDVRNAGLTIGRHS
jgi:DNA uptake protein ComE-like DNA-binding protein